MIRVELDRAGLFEFARNRRIPLREVDLGYIIHCALRGLFAEQAPQPFSWSDGRRSAAVLGYGAASATELKQSASGQTDQSLFSLYRESTLVSKEIPAVFPTGHQLNFEIRTCPIVRKSAAGKWHRKGAEVDVFLSRCWQEGEDVIIDRGEVYREWLSQRLAKGGATRLVSSRMLAFHRERVVRSSHGKKNSFKVSERPVAILAGTLEVQDPDAFHALLRRGVGRHCAFGFGMLLLRPSDRP